MRFWMIGEDARPTPKGIVQKFSVASHQPIKIKYFKTEKFSTVNTQILFCNITKDSEYSQKYETVNKN